MRTLAEIESHYNQWTEEQIRGIMGATFLKSILFLTWLAGEQVAVMSNEVIAVLDAIRADYNERIREQTQTMLGMDFLADMGDLLKHIDR